MIDKIDLSPSPKFELNIFATHRIHVKFVYLVCDQISVEWGFSFFVSFFLRPCLCFLRFGICILMWSSIFQIIKYTCVLFRYWNCCGTVLCCIPIQLNYKGSCTFALGGLFKIICLVYFVRNVLFFNWIL